MLDNIIVKDPSFNIKDRIEYVAEHEKHRFVTSVNNFANLRLWGVDLSEIKYINKNNGMTMIDLTSIKPVLIPIQKTVEVDEKGKSIRKNKVIVNEKLVYVLAMNEINAIKKSIKRIKEIIQYTIENDNTDKKELE